MSWLPICLAGSCVTFGFKKLKGNDGYFCHWYTTNTIGFATSANTLLIYLWCRLLGALSWRRLNKHLYMNDQNVLMMPLPPGVCEYECVCVRERGARHWCIWPPNLHSEKTLLSHMIFSKSCILWSNLMRGHITMLQTGILLTGTKK